MYCTNCGKELAEGAKFCTGCGSPIKSVVSQACDDPISENPSLKNESTPEFQSEQEQGSVLETASVDEADSKQAASSDAQLSSTVEVHQTEALFVTQESSDTPPQSPLLHKIQEIFSNLPGNRIMIGICAVVVVAILVGIGIWLAGENAKAHEPFAFRIEAVFPDEGIDDTSGVPVRIEGSDLDNNKVEKNILITSPNDSIELLQGEYRLSVAGDPVSVSGQFYASRASEVTIEITEEQVGVTAYHYYDAIERNSEESTELTIGFEAVPAEEVTDQFLEEARNWMKEFGINDEDIDRYLDAAVEFRNAELERIANEEALAKTRALQEAAFGSFPATFSFSSGVGAWGSTMKVNSDGSFEEEYHDMNAGESGPGYKQTLYCGKFIGSFAVLEQVGSTTFKLQLNELRSTRNAGESIDKDGVRTVYTEKDSNGLGEVTSSPVEGFTLYLPGTDRSALPPLYQGWLNDGSGAIDYFVLVSPDGATWVTAGQ